MEKNKIIYIIIIAIVIIIGFDIYLYINNQNSYNPSSSLNIPVKSSEPNNVDKQNNSVKSSDSLSYGNAVKIYNNRRIQFSVDSYNYCSVSPSNSVFKKGTDIMLDNRHSKKITVSLDGQMYYMNAYGFKIITITTSAKLPHTIKINCGTGKNNGSIFLEQ